MYTIKEAAARTGLSIPVLRAWERRYGIVAPARTPGGYRVYDEAALGRLRAMRRLVDDGWAPSAAAAAIADGTAPAGLASPAATRRRPAIRPLTALTIPARSWRASRSRCRARQRRGSRMSSTRCSRPEPTSASSRRSSRRRSGPWGARGRTERSRSPASTLPATPSSAASPPRSRRRARRRSEPPVLVGMPPGSHHELGSLIFATAARRSGMAVAYLGADLPLPDWIGGGRSNRGTGGGHRRVDAGRCGRSTERGGGSARSESEPAHRVRRTGRAGARRGRRSPPGSRCGCRRTSPRRSRALRDRRRPTTSGLTRRLRGAPRSAA